MGVVTLLSASATALISVIGTKVGRVLNYLR
jgi:hypothetical protein